MKIKFEATKISLVWIIPALALVLTAIFTYKQYNDNEFRINVEFANPGGLEAGKTNVKYKNINIGTVRDIRFSEDLQKIYVTLGIKDFMRDQITENSLFWIQKPQIGIRGIEGLDTIISGFYVSVLPRKGKLSNNFVGLNRPPVLRSEGDGTYVKLYSDKLGNIKRGSQVIYKGISAGYITDYQIINREEEDFIEITIFVRKPYDKNITKDTYFWRSGTLAADLLNSGLKVSVDSIESLFFGGISFEHFPGKKLLNSSKKNKGTYLPLFLNYETLNRQIAPSHIQLATIFKESVNGLDKNSLVEYRGIPVGRVSDYDFYPAKGTGIQDVQILVSFFVNSDAIEKFGLSYDKASSSLESASSEFFQKAIRNGLYARLTTSNLISGSLKIDLDIDSSRKKQAPKFIGKTLLIPNEKGLNFTNVLNEIREASGQMSRAGSSVTKIAKDINQLPLVKISAQTKELISRLNHTMETVNMIPFEKTMENLNQSVLKISQIIEKIDANEFSTKTENLYGKADNILEKFENTVNNANKQLKFLADPKNRYRYKKLIQSTENSIQSLEDLIEKINNNPESLIYGRQ